MVLGHFMDILLIALRQRAMHKDIGKCSNADLMVNLLKTLPPKVMFSIIMLMFCRTDYDPLN